MMDGWELVEYVHDAQTPTELEVVLAERLESALRKLWAARYDEAAHRHDYEGQE